MTRRYFFNTHHLVAILQDLYKLIVSQGALWSPSGGVAWWLIYIRIWGSKKNSGSFNPFFLCFFTLFLIPHLRLILVPYEKFFYLHFLDFSIFLLLFFFFYNKSRYIFLQGKYCFMAPAYETHFVVLDFSFFSQKKFNKFFFSLLSFFISFFSSLFLNWLKKYF